MTPAARLVVAVVAALALLPGVVAVILHMPRFGDHPLPYGDAINRLAPVERHVTNMVTAVNFDYRGFDTLGEEFILFISVVGVTLLLRRQKQETEDEDGGEKDESPKRNVPDPSSATKVLTLGLIGPLVLFGLYVVLHGQLTPGGGFQGGVILATAPLLVYLAGDLKAFKHITSHTLIEVAEAAGAGGYVAIGLAGLVMGANFLQNILPLGKTGAINSAGTIFLISVSVGLEVAAGFVLLLHAFLEQTLEIQLRGSKK